MAVIASILITSSVRLIPFGFMGQLWVQDKGELMILLATCAVCIFEDGALGLMVGCFLALLRNAADNNVALVTFVDGGVVFVGQLSFVNSLDAENRIVDWIEETQPTGGVQIDLTKLTYCDVDAADVFINLNKKFGKDYSITFVGVEESKSGAKDQEWYLNLVGDGKVAEEGGEKELFAVSSEYIANNGY